MTDARPKPYTTRTRVALAIARGIAAGRGDDDVTAAHVALGLLREGENAMVAALDHGGVDVRALRRDLEASLGAPPGRTAPDQVTMPLTPGERRVVAHATADSDRHGDEYVGAEHLLAALVHDGGEPAAQVLARHGFDAAAVATHLGAVVRRHA